MTGENVPSLFDDVSAGLDSRLSRLIMAGAAAMIDVLGRGLKSQQSYINLTLYILNIFIFLSPSDTSTKLFTFSRSNKFTGYI